MSLRGTIIDNVVSTVAAIAVSGGYTLTAGEAKRGYKHFNAVPEDKLTSGKFAAYAAGADEKRKNAAQRTFFSDMEIALAVYVKTADASDAEQLERDLDSAIADVTKALMVDITRGGVATTTEISEINTDKGAFIPYASAEMIVRCEYRTGVSAP